MSGIGNWLWGTSQLDDAVDKATSELLPAGAEDIALNLEICDQIRSKSIPAKDAMRALKRRLNHKNPNVQNLALGLTDICVKNGGDQFLAEISSREFMDNLVSILKIPALNIEVKNNILRLVQNWSIAFEGKAILSYVGQVYKTLINEGFKFPPKDLAIANSAMVDTQTAPEWIDSEVCLRCRTAFTFTNRKHHCRNCGQVFDQACSSKFMPLPHFGITQEVRVCEGCYSKLTKKADKIDKGHRHSTSLHGARNRNAREFADAELQRAIQLSLQEVGNARPGYTPSQPSPSNWQYSEPPIVDRSSHPDTKYSTTDEEDDPDLKAAIEASLREANAPKPSAPVALDSPRIEHPSYSYAGPGYSQSYPPSVAPAPAPPAIPNYDLEPLESDAILTFSQTIEQVEAQGGRDISRYPAVNELYDKASSLRPKLALSLDDTGRKEQMLSDMHDKLSQAVKLYDKLLTEQVAHPRWRSPQTITSPSAPTPASYQQANSSYSTGYNTANGYSQWTSPVPATAGYQSQPEIQRQPQSPQMAYNPVPPAPTHYSNQPHAESSQSQVQWQQQQPQYTQSSLQYAPTPAPPQAIIPTQLPPQPQRQSSYTEPSQYHQYAMSPPPQTQSQTQGLPPVSLPSHHYQHSIPSSQPTPTPAPVLSAPHSPPAQYAAALSQPGNVLPSSSLSRHKTVSYASPPQPPPANTHLGRSNTVTYQHRQQVQQQHVPTPAPLPHFPVAPTSAPQSFPMYAPSIPTGVAQTEERKEALLIDL